MLVGISQRRSTELPHTDVLESGYAEYFEGFGIQLMPIANNLATAHIDQSRIEGVILSGGGDVHPQYYGGTFDPTAHYSLERDKAERQLLRLATAQKLPVLGICRGMQSLNVMFGGEITQNAQETSESFQQHVRTRHNLTISNVALEKVLETDTVQTNSFHDSVICPSNLASELLPFATAEDGTIEGLYHPYRALAAIMWHPERESSITPLNSLLTEAFKNGEFFWRSQG